jgi:hypothetical protein
MNELYNETIVRNGKTYHYNPDHDIYHPRYTDESVFSQYAWIVLCVILAAVCYWVEYT